ncbi:MAG: hypothetical protein V8Q30_07755 [Acutalibacteraceae bacterium]
MMTVFCEGRDYGYELAGVAMLFFRGEKVIPAKEGEEPSGQLHSGGDQPASGPGIAVGDGGAGGTHLGGQ